MALDPNIPLMAKPTDVAAGLMQGFQIARGIRKTRLEEEEAERSRRLQPLREQVLQAQVAALPGEAEDRARQRQLNIMKMNATSDFMLAKKLEPLIASQSWDKAAKLIEADKTVSEDSRSAILDAVNNKDILGSVSLINAAYENGYSIAGFNRPEVASSVRPIEALDPATGERFFATVNAQGGLNRVTGGVPPPPVVQQTNAAVKGERDQKNIDKQLLSINDLLRAGRISEGDAADLRAIAASGDPKAVASTMQTILTGRGISATTYAALNQKNANAMADFEGRKRKAVEEAKSNNEIVQEAGKASASIDGLISGYETALQLIDEGAATGAIETLFPSIKNASVELEKLQGILALEALASTNLTPVSNADLAVLKDNVLPRQIDDLRPWVEKKIGALKRAQIYQQQRASYFGSEGARMADWLSPSNWSNNSFSLIPSANRAGGATTAITNPDVPFPPNVPPGRAPVTSRTLSQPIEVDF